MVSALIFAGGIVIDILVAMLLFVPVRAAVRLGVEMPAVRPETAKDAQMPKPLSLEGTTRYRLLMFPEGRKQYIGLFTIWERCE